MTVPSRTTRDADIREIRGRILTVLPAATYQMDRFFQFADIDFSERTETACVEVGAEPRLHLNPRFVRMRCKRDEHLLMLVLHELYHVILGHTRLFARLTEAHNVAFDAIINSLLCRQFPGPEYVSFFTRLNPADRFPGRLLRPPRGWPRRMEVARGASPEERALMSLLYGARADSVTYQEVLSVLERTLETSSCGSCVHTEAPGRHPDEPNNSGGEGYVLIGDHGGARGSGEMDQTAVGDAVFKDILRRITEKWPARAGLGVGRDRGSRAFDFLMPRPRNPRADFVTALRRLLLSAGVLQPDPASPYAWKRIDDAQETSTTVVNWRDRRVHAWTTLTGLPQLLFRDTASCRRTCWRPRNVAHVYLDVSGSMARELPWLVGALEPLQRRGLCRLYAFSTVVAEVGRCRLLKDEIPNTFGTDISCVYSHLLALAPSRTPRRVVVLTDGFTGEPPTQHLAEAQKRKTRVTVGVVGGNGRRHLGYASIVETLPALA